MLAAKLSEEAKLSNLLFGSAADVVKEEDSEGLDEHDEPVPKKSKTETRPAWRDEDDETVTLGGALRAQGRTVVGRRSGRYAHYLQNKYEALVGNPDWARLDTVDQGDDGDDEILRRTGHLAKNASSHLKKGLLDMKKMKNLNVRGAQKSSVLKVVQFHPTASVALLGGTSGLLSLLNVDGKLNEKLHCVSFPDYPLHCGRFSPDGDRAFLGSVHSHCHVYHLTGARTTRVGLPRGVTKMDLFEVSPCGKHLAVAGRFGEVHILCARSAEKIRTLKKNCAVTALHFGRDGARLYAHGVDGTVTVWDTGSLRAVHRWADSGCVNGTCLTTSPSGEYLATGSAQGVVNVYAAEDTLRSGTPVPERTLANLTTRISGVTFHPFSELLTFHSSQLPDAIRTVHLPSFQVYSNFPRPGVDMGHCAVTAFSPNGGFFAIGTNKKLAYLYRLKHYKNY